MAGREKSGLGYHPTIWGKIMALWIILVMMGAARRHVALSFRFKFHSSSPGERGTAHRPSRPIHREWPAHGLVVQTQPFLEVGTSRRISTWRVNWIECQSRGVLVAFRRGFSAESSRPASQSTTKYPSMTSFDLLTCWNSVIAQPVNGP